MVSEFESERLLDVPVERHCFSPQVKLCHPLRQHLMCLTEVIRPDVFDSLLEMPKRT